MVLFSVAEGECQLQNRVWGHNSHNFTSVEVTEKLENIKVWTSMIVTVNYVELWTIVVIWTVLMEGSSYGSSIKALRSNQTWSWRASIFYFFLILIDWLGFFCLVGKAEMEWLCTERNTMKLTVLTVTWRVGSYSQSIRRFTVFLIIYDCPFCLMVGGQKKVTRVIMGACGCEI